MAISTAAELGSTPNRARRVSAIIALPDWLGRLAAKEVTLGLLVYTAVALLLRAPMFGEPTVNIDDQFYALVGQRMLDGATMYVDIWDRKGPLLYVLFAGIEAISRAPAFYQFVATLFAIAGALCVQGMARSLTDRRAALMAGIAYLALLQQFKGGTAQTPVFYNPLMLLAAWSVATRLPLLAAGRIDMRLVLGMTSAGLAIAIKQSAAIESAFFGVFILVALVKARAPLLRIVAICTGLLLVALLPYVIAALYYLNDGHFAQFWQATVESNFRRQYSDPNTHIIRACLAIGRISLLSVLVWFSLRNWQGDAQGRGIIRFYIGWIATAVAAIFIFPNIFDHYLLPLAGPFCILMANVFTKRGIGTVSFVAIIAIAMAASGSLNLAKRWRAHTASAAFTQYVAEETPTRKLLVWGMPSYLYSALDIPPPSILAFPPHLYDAQESGAAGIDEVAEVHRILASHPQTLVVWTQLDRKGPRKENWQSITDYQSQCGKRKLFTLYEDVMPRSIMVYSQCGTRTATAH